MSDDHIKRNLYLIKSSLVSFTNDCVLFETKAGEKKFKSKSISANIEPFDTDKALEALNKVYNNFTPRQIRESNGSVLIELSSNACYFCNIHGRQHDHENAYIIIKGLMKNVWFNCRRIETHEKQLGPQFICSLFDKIKPDYKRFNIKFVK